MNYRILDPRVGISHFDYESRRSYRCLGVRCKSSMHNAMPADATCKNGTSRYKFSESATWATEWHEHTIRFTLPRGPYKASLGLHSMEVLSSINLLCDGLSS